MRLILVDEASFERDRALKGVCRTPPPKYERKKSYFGFKLKKFLPDCFLIFFTCTQIRYECENSWKAG